MSIGQVLAELRDEKGIYQKELAAYLNVSVGTISNYEKGIHAPDLDTLCRLADYFGVTTDYLLGRTRYKYSLETLNRPVFRNYTVTDIINTTIELTPSDKRYLIDHMELLRERSAHTRAEDRSGG